jgi:hypothetical protein
MVGGNGGSLAARSAGSGTSATVIGTSAALARASGGSAATARRISASISAIVISTGGGNSSGRQRPSPGEVGRRVGAAAELLEREAQHVVGVGLVGGAPPAPARAAPPRRGTGRG